MFIVNTATADAYLAKQQSPEPVPPPEPPKPDPGDRGNGREELKDNGPDRPYTPASQAIAPPPIVAPIAATPAGLSWTGSLPAQKWTTFYMKVLTKLATAGNLKLDVRVSFTAQDGISHQKVEELRAALRELGLPDQIDLERG